MDQALAKLLENGIRSMQSLVGETVTINGITYPCVVGNESIHTPLEPGGFKSVASVSISIALCDILQSPVAPAIGNPALLVQRSRTYRIDAISPTQTTWELQLMDVTA